MRSSQKMILVGGFVLFFLKTSSHAYDIGLQDLQTGTKYAVCLHDKSVVMKACDKGTPLVDVSCSSGMCGTEVGRVPEKTFWDLADSVDTGQYSKTRSSRTDLKDALELVKDQQTKIKLQTWLQNLEAILKLQDEIGSETLKGKYGEDDLEFKIITAAFKKHETNVADKNKKEAEAWQAFQNRQTIKSNCIAACVDTQVACVNACPEEYNAAGYETASQRLCIDRCKKDGTRCCDGCWAVYQRR